MSTEWSTPNVGAGPSGPRSGFGERFVAAFIDGLIYFVVFGILFVILKGAAFPLATLGSLAYYTYFEGSPSGQTPGKRVMNIRVIDFQTGGPLGYGKAALRFVCRIISGSVCYLGYLWMLWDKEKQTWHDKLAGTVVVPTAAYPVEKWPG